MDCATFAVSMNRALSAHSAAHPDYLDLARDLGASPRPDRTYHALRALGADLIFRPHGPSGHATHERIASSAHLRFRSQRKTQNSMGFGAAAIALLRLPKIFVRAARCDVTA